MIPVGLSLKGTKSRFFLLTVQILVGVLVVILLLWLAFGYVRVKPSAESINPAAGIVFENGAASENSNLSGTAFENPYNRDTKIWKFRTFIKLTGFCEMKPALIEVYAEERITPNGGPMSAHAIQHGYSICVSPSMTEISSRMQESLEDQMGFHMIQRVIIHYADTSSADWKNAKGTVRW